MSNRRVEGSPTRDSSRTGAGDGIRTRDPQLGRLMLYQLSYSREWVEGFGSQAVGPSEPKAPNSKLVGREGFEPPYSFENRFTVCRL